MNVTEADHPDYRAMVTALAHLFRRRAGGGYRDTSPGRAMELARMELHKGFDKQGGLEAELATWGTGSPLRNMFDFYKSRGF